MLGLGPRPGRVPGSPRAISLMRQRRDHFGGAGDYGTRSRLIRCSELLRAATREIVSDARIPLHNVGDADGGFACSLRARRGSSGRGGGGAGLNLGPVALHSSSAARSKRPACETTPSPHSLSTTGLGDLLHGSPSRGATGAGRSPSDLSLGPSNLTCSRANLCLPRHHAGRARPRRTAAPQPCRPYRTHCFRLPHHHEVPASASFRPVPPGTRSCVLHRGAGSVRDFPDLPARTDARRLGSTQTSPAAPVSGEAPFCRSDAVRRHSRRPFPSRSRASDLR